MEVIPLLHNISSIQRMIDFVKLSIAIGASRIVITRAYGAAAQHGIGEVGRLAYKAGVSLIVLPDLGDAVDLLKPDHTLIITREHAAEAISPSRRPDLNGRVLVAFNGGDPDFSKQEAALGMPVYIEGVTGRLGPVGEAALVLYTLIRGESGSG